MPPRQAADPPARRGNYSGCGGFMIVTTMKNQAALRILVLAAIPTAAAQTYTFSACNGVGVPGNALFTDQKGTFIYTITQVISGGAVPGASGYSYTAMANYTAVSSLGAAKNFTNVPSAVTIGFLTVGPQGR